MSCRAGRSGPNRKPTWILNQHRTAALIGLLGCLAFTQAEARRGLFSPPPQTYEQTVQRQKYDPVPWEYSGSLRPARDVKRLISGNTLVVEGLGEGRIDKTRKRYVDKFFFDPRGVQSTGSSNSGRWVVIGNQICPGPEIRACRQVVVDDAGQLYWMFRNKLEFLAKITSVQKGDVFGLVQAAAIAEQRAREAHRRTAERLPQTLDELEKFRRALGGPHYGRNCKSIDPRTGAVHYGNNACGAGLWEYID